MDECEESKLNSTTLPHFKDGVCFASRLFSLRCLLRPSPPVPRGRTGLCCTCAGLLQLPLDRVSCLCICLCLLPPAHSSQSGLFLKYELDLIAPLVIVCLWWLFILVRVKSEFLTMACKSLCELAFHPPLLFHILFTLFMWLLSAPLVSFFHPWPPQASSWLSDRASALLPSRNPFFHVLTWSSSCSSLKSQLKCYLLRKDFPSWQTLVALSHPIHSV